MWGVHSFSGRTVNQWHEICEMKKKPCYAPSLSNCRSKPEDNNHKNFKIRLRFITCTSVEGHRTGKVEVITVSFIFGGYEWLINWLVGLFFLWFIAWLIDWLTDGLSSNEKVITHHTHLFSVFAFYYRDGIWLAHFWKIQQKRVFLFSQSQGRKKTTKTLWLSCWYMQLQSSSVSILMICWSP